MANVVVAGNICVVDNPEAEGSDGTPHEFKRCLLIQFPDTESIRAAITAQKIEFTVFESDPLDR